MKKHLQSKTYSIVQQLASYFIVQKEGSRILNVESLAKKFGVAQGTIQNGLAFLKKEKIVTLSSHGKMGTNLIHKDIPKLLEASELTMMVGVMPLPYTKLYEGMSTGLMMEYENKLSQLLTMSYVRGALKRMELVCLNRYDFAVVSKFAAKQFDKENPDKIEIALEFPKYTYLQGHCIYFSDQNKTKLENGMRVALDSDSIDQRRITEQVCKGFDVEFVKIQYTNIKEKLDRGEIDAAIFNQDEFDSGYKGIRVDVEEQDNTMAVLVVSKNRPEIKTLLSESLSIQSIIQIQKEVVENERIPEY